MVTTDFEEFWQKDLFTQKVRKTPTNSFSEISKNQGNLLPAMSAELQLG
jgi:hypothetical protein